MRIITNQLVIINQEFSGIVLFHQLLFYRLKWMKFESTMLDEHEL